jgi:phenylpyruvate tautomerase PptA (4-oxalocrotonate tautomerase family)
MPGTARELNGLTKELVRRISQDFQEVANIAPESLHILFHDMEKDDWGNRGILASEQPK